LGEFKVGKKTGVEGVPLEENQPGMCGTSWVKKGREVISSNTNQKGFFFNSKNSSMPSTKKTKKIPGDGHQE